MKLSKKIVCSVLGAIALITGGVAVESHQPIGKVTIEQTELGELRVSPVALDIIGNAEGCRRDPYQCPAGLVTNGIGNTHDVPNDLISLEQVAKDWVKNLQNAEQCVTTVERRSGHTMSQGQFDALTSFVFNVGCTRFRRNADGSATRIYTYALQGEKAKACQELTRWVYSGGQKLNGLITRREKEHARCMAVD